MPSSRVHRTTRVRRIQLAGCCLSTTWSVLWEDGASPPAQSRWRPKDLPTGSFARPSSLSWGFSFPLLHDEDTSWAAVKYRGQHVHARLKKRPDHPASACSRWELPLYALKDLPFPFCSISMYRQRPYQVSHSIESEARNFMFSTTFREALGPTGLLSNVYSVLFLPWVMREQRQGLI